MYTLMKRSFAGGELKPLLRFVRHEKLRADVVLINLICGLIKFQVLLRCDLPLSWMFRVLGTLYNLRTALRTGSKEVSR